MSTATGRAAAAFRHRGWPHASRSPGRRWRNRLIKCAVLDGLAAHLSRSAWRDKLSARQRHPQPEVHYRFSPSAGNPNGSWDAGSLSYVQHPPLCVNGQRPRALTVHPMAGADKHRRIPQSLQCSGPAPWPQVTPNIVQPARGNLGLWPASAHARTQTSLTSRWPSAGVYPKLPRTLVPV